MTTVTAELFGTFQDASSVITEPVTKYTIKTTKGIEVHLLSYGAAICGIVVPDKNGKFENVVLGFDGMTGYQSYNYHGSTVGRVANRICQGRFTLNGQEYQLPINNNGNHLHGGPKGWSQKVWEGKMSPNSVVFSLTSPNGDEGYPGTVTARVRYTLSETGRLEIAFSAQSDQDTPINMTNHAFFNLAGHGAGPDAIAEHTVQFNCDKYLPVDETLIPTGERVPVEGTCYDFRSPKQLGPAVLESEDEGYDHCFVLSDDNRGYLRLAAKFRHPPSGRILEVHTSEPAIQFYTGNFLPSKRGEMVGRGGVSYVRQGAFCCEPQNFPDFINVEEFPNGILKAGEIYQHSMVYSFSHE